MDLSREKSSKIELFEFQNWDVYKKSLSVAKVLFLVSKELKNKGYASLSDQLNRAVSSIPLNLAEGVSRYSLKEKVNYWRISKGSLFECVSIIDLIEAVTDLKIENKYMLLKDMTEVGKMLSGLIRWAEKEQGKS